MKHTIFTFLAGLVALLGCSCEPQDSDQISSQNELSYVSQSVPTQLKGGYYSHTSVNATGKEEVVIELTADRFWIKDIYDLDLNQYRVFVNGTCWTIIFLSDTQEIRISDYIKEENFVHITLWENGKMIKDLGIYDKIKEKETQP
ncbi:hypothetical protein GN157_14340 [Flavobacterium rakeshii]|uniref:Lipoprotein n=1 Tax=Flavobacterium rakeshii TaxID=1038845 RepID=A0A6N8HGM5_9FLAO|nr:hypothetical protein [Flavobacterium rakeshii]MUV04892.1 hypothetical protein [Flavobacterium rakeshii]